MYSSTLSRACYIAQVDLVMCSCLSLPGTGILGILCHTHLLYIFSNNLQVESGESRSRDALLGIAIVTMLLICGMPPLSRKSAHPTQGKDGSTANQGCLFLVDTKCC